MLSVVVIDSRGQHWGQQPLRQALLPPDGAHRQSDSSSEARRQTRAPLRWWRPVSRARAERRQMVAAEVPVRRQRKTSLLGRLSARRVEAGAYPDVARAAAASGDSGGGP